MIVIVHFREVQGQANRVFNCITYSVMQKVFYFIKYNSCINLNIDTLLIGLILSLCGDVHPNPGPINKEFHPNRRLKLCHINVRSLSSDNFYKVNLINSKLVLLDQYDVICISETWLDKWVSNTDLAIQGYNLFWRDRNRHGGGVAIYISEMVVAKCRQDIENIAIESVVIEIVVDSKHLFVMCCYRPPRSSVVQAQELISNVQTQLDCIYKQ